MSKVLDIRRQTAQKMAQPAKTCTPAANGQKPLQACVMRAEILQKLATTRAFCEQRRLEREEAEQPNGGGQ